MEIKELWDNMQGEFSKINLRLGKLEETTAKIPEIEKQVSKIESRLETLEVELKKTNEKLDQTINVNIAKLLNEQTEMRKEFNEKLDKAILQNNVEHKRFAYQIAELEEKVGIVRVG